MKNAVIVFGSHYHGKSKTINQHLKPKLGLSEKAHKFKRNDLDGYILSQSFEESGRNVDDVIEKYGHFDLLVLACRPSNETPSELNEVTAKLENLNFSVYKVLIQKNSLEKYYDTKANEVLACLDEK